MDVYTHIVDIIISALESFISRCLLVGPLFSTPIGTISESTNM